MKDSNFPPTACKAAALPDELIGLVAPHRVIHDITALQRLRGCDYIPKPCSHALLVFYQNVATLVGFEPTSSR